MTKKPKILLFDIEIAGNFGANAGYILCFGYKYLGEKKTHLISIRDFPESYKADPTNDKPLLKACEKILSEADAWVTWYGLKFDVPFIQTRRLINRMKPLPSVPHIDGWRIAKYQLKFTRNSLDIVSRSLPTLDEKKIKEEKTHLDFSLWMRAAAGHLKSLKYIENHCVVDVKVLEDAYLQLRPFAKGLPSLNLLTGPYMGCPSCGSMKTQKRGLQATHLSVKQSHGCKDCGHRFLTAISKRVTA